MGQGRRRRLAIRCVLLIVSAIQGITPDARDIASARAIRLVGSALLGRVPRLVEDESHEACEALQAARSGQPAQQGESWARNGPSDRVERSPGESGREIGSGPGLVVGIPRGGDLSLSLCRLVC